MGKKEKIEYEEEKEVETREDRKSRVLSYISNMESQSENKITNVAKEISIHPDTLRPILDDIERDQDVGKINQPRDSEGKALRLVKLPDDRSDLEFRSEIRNYFANINKRMDIQEDNLKKINTKLKINSRKI